MQLQVVRTLQDERALRHARFRPLAGWLAGSAYCGGPRGLDLDLNLWLLVAATSHGALVSSVCARSWKDGCYWRSRIRTAAAKAGPRLTDSRWEGRDPNRGGPGVSRLQVQDQYLLTTWQASRSGGACFNGPGPDRFIVDLAAVSWPCGD
jgi:hypothetical protein